MFLDRLRNRPMWLQIAWSAFISFGVLHLLVGVLVLVVMIRHHVAECDEIIALATDDLIREYEEYRGDASRLKLEMSSDVETHGKENLFLLVSSPSGRIVAAESSSDSVLRKMALEAKGGKAGTYRFKRDHRSGLGREVSIRARKTPLPDGNVLSVGYNVTDAEYNLIHVAVLLGSAMLMTLFVGALTGAALARKFTAPLRNLVVAAERIADGDYAARVQSSAEGWEIAAVEDTFNRMGDKNEEAMADLRSLTDDIAHDLRTPLTRLMASAEAAALGNADLRRPLPETVTDEVSAMLEMINTMLEISQTENRIDKTPRESVDLVSFVTRAVDLYSALAEDYGISLESNLPQRPVMFSGHAGKLQRLLGNLLDNAMKFTPKGGRVVVSLLTDPVVLTVANTGPGIAAEEIPHVFKRFWRAEKSRSLPGNGLGLALVKAIATSYGGSASCISEPNGWTTFRITLTCASSFQPKSLW